MLKALPFIRYDYYKDQQGEYTDDGSIPFFEYLNSNIQMSIAAGNGRLRSSGTCSHIPGERGRFSGQVATEDGRIFAQSLLQNLWVLEQNNECLGTFSEQNIRFRDKMSVLYNVERRKLDLLQLKANYKCAKKIIHDAFSKAGPIPDDIEHLLDLMENEFDKRSLFRVHASLWSLSDRGGMYMRMHEHLKVLSVPQVYQIMCVMGRMKYKIDWRTLVRTNDLLARIYNSKKPQYAKKNIQGQKAMEYSEGKLFTDYLRNRVAHRMDAYKLGVSYTAQGSELAALVRWPMALVTLQYELHKCKTSGDLNDGELY